MSSIDLFGIFLLLATIAVIINRKLPKLPDTIGVMLFSLISCLLMLGVSQFWHHDILSVPKKLLISMDMPDIFLHVALPLLLFAGTMGVNLKHLLNRVVSITSLSIIGTVISIFVFGTILFYVFPVFNVHIGYSWCIAIGAILAPTDPVSVVSVLKKLGLPAPVQAVFAGESLFNDGIAVSIFSMAMGTALSTSIIPIKVGSELNDAFNLFLREGIGGIIVGFCTGYIAIRVLRKIPDIHVSLLVTLTLAICTYSLADAIDTSGAIAVVVSGLWFGNEKFIQEIPDRLKISVKQFWETIENLINALVFLVMGAEVIFLVPSWAILPIILIVLPISVLSRFAGVFIATLPLNITYDSKNRLCSILTWGGIRGGISISLALGLPDGDIKNILAPICYAVVVFSIVVQGLTMESLAKKLYTEKLNDEMK